MLREGLSFPEYNLTDEKPILEAITHKYIIKSISHAKHDHGACLTLSPPGGNFRAIDA